MLARLLALLLTSFLLAGCLATERATAPASEAIPVAFTIRAEAAGPITAATPYSAAALRQLFPGERVEVTQTADEGGVVSALTVFHEGLQVFLVLPERGGRTIRAVHGAGLAVAGPEGQRLGATFAEIGVKRAACRVGTGPWAGMAICRSPRTPNVQLVFDNGGWTGPLSELPPANVLGTAMLQRIVWLPVRG